MTPPASEFTPEKMRLRILKGCGWKRCKIAASSYGGCGDILKDGWMRPDGVKFYFHRTPDYPNDLNACAEMEKVLTLDQQRQYLDELQQILNDKNRHIPTWYGPTAFDYRHAEPMDLCLAFCRVMFPEEFK